MYDLIAENVRKERRRRCISQADLAERAEISVDTVKSIENGRRTMSLDTYLRIVKALDVAPFDLMDRGLTDNYIERFIFIINRRSDQEIEFVLYIAEQLLKGKDMLMERSCK